MAVNGSLSRFRTMGCEWKITAFFMHRRGRPGYHMLISNDN
ncbi:MAG: hypothetical protein ACLFR2_09595 [Candidatus Kapaibacterium sp.]